MKKISVCVPTYNRPEMINTLIPSFLSQDYPNKELIICDDSSNTKTHEVVNSYQSEYIAYIRNAINVGYHKNLLNSLMSGRGNYLLVLGDDDMFLSTHALSSYVSVFEEYPSVGYVYCNQVQFSNDFSINCIIRHFNANTLCKQGEEAMRTIWITSTFIPGMAIRNDKSTLQQFYPQQTMLFPQVELIGHVINTSNAYGISDFLVAGRSHDQQLGFNAILKRDIKGKESHGTIELIEIFRRLNDIYHFNDTSEFLERNLLQSYYYMIFKEKMMVGNKLITENYRNFCNISPIAKNSLQMKICYYFAIFIPKWILRIARRGVISLSIKNNYKTIMVYQKMLNHMLFVFK